MENKLFVGNLSWHAEEQELQDLFAKAGNVTEVAIMRDKFTGRARGFAFVTMSTDAEAEEAVRMFEGQEFMGRPMKVNVARPREDRPQGGGGGGFQRGGGGGQRRGFGGPRQGGGGYDRGPRRGGGGGFRDRGDSYDRGGDQY